MEELCHNFHEQNKKRGSSNFSLRASLAYSLQVMPHRLGGLEVVDSELVSIVNTRRAADGEMCISPMLSSCELTAFRS